jgi:hypothetical protein
MYLQNFLAALGTALAFASHTAAQTAPDKPFREPPPDRAIRTGTVSGKLLAFQWGDYLHLAVRTRSGEEKWFFVDHHCLTYFLPLHHHKTIALHYRVLDRYVPEAAGMQRMEAAFDASVDGQKCTDWMRGQRATKSHAQIDEEFEPLFKKYLRE